METVVKVLMVLVAFSFLLKLTSYKRVQGIVMLLLCAAFTGFSWHFAVEQSRTGIAAWLSDAGLLLDLAVLLTVDVVLQMAYCLLAVQLMGSGKLGRRTIAVYRLLRFFPGILIFVVMLYAVTAAVFALPGKSFAAVSWCCAGGVLLIFGGGAFALRRLLPEKEIRLELLFLSNALTACLGIIASVNGRTAVGAVDEVDYLSALGVTAAPAAVAAMGWLVYLFKKRQ